MSYVCYINPPHPIRDSEKLQAIVESLRESGWVGRPVLVIKVADYLQALTGSHRLAACGIADVEPETVQIENVQLTEEQVDAIEVAVPSLTWKHYWDTEHYLNEALESAHDDEDRLAVLRVVLGDDSEAVAVMTEEIAANR